MALEKASDKHSQQKREQCSDPKEGIGMEQVQSDFLEQHQTKKTYWEKCLDYLCCCCLSRSDGIKKK
ncbi:hypothetical protein CIPAW_13G009700 [Carya illinoinensis]|uniref:Uncharacterized protein n=1 Tax=Carya illinoinensis TaxID=32201 RepID=A0A8T1NKT7_CARIL|nr:hypothetical protein CIPAW_13G009700 [Carya illinoinensis]